MNAGGARRRQLARTPGEYTARAGSARRAVSAHGEAAPDGGSSASRGAQAVGPGPVERDAAIAERDERRVADHDVVEQLDVEKPARRERLCGEVQVVRAGCRIRPM